MFLIDYVFELLESKNDGTDPDNDDDVISPDDLYKGIHTLCNCMCPCEASNLVIETLTRSLCWGVQPDFVTVESIQRLQYTWWMGLLFTAEVFAHYVTKFSMDSELYERKISNPSAHLIKETCAIWETNKLKKEMDELKKNASRVWEESTRKETGEIEEEEEEESTKKET